MSKKDYQAIAAAIYRTRARHAAFTQHFDGVRYSAFDSLVEEMGDMLAADNSRFNADRFREACETGKCRGMRQVRS
jgi:hypothetical protein